jgi:hypothetical protein
MERLVVSDSVVSAQLTVTLTHRCSETRADGERERERASKQAGVDEFREI